MAITDDIINQLGTHTSQLGNDIYSTILSSTYVIVTIALIVVGGIIAIRAAKRYTEYAGTGTKLGAYNLSSMDGTHITGNLSKDDFFREEILDKLKVVENRFNISFDEFRKMLNDKKIFVYDFRITDHSKAWTLTNIRDMKIISTAKLESEDYSWQDQKGRFSLTGVGFKEYPKNVFGYKESKVYPIIDPWGKEVDVYYFEPIPREEVKTILGDMGHKQITIHVTRINTTEGLAKAIENLPVIIKMYTEFEVKNQELRHTQELLDQEHKAHAKTNAKLNRARHLLGEKIFVGFGKPITPLQKGIEWAWIIGSYWLGYIGIKQIAPSFQNMPEWVLPVGIFIIIIALRQFTEKRKSPDELIKEESAEGIM